MEKKNYIVAIDLGSHNVTAAAATRGADDKMVIEAVVREKSEGVSGGAIDNIELAAKSLKTAVGKLEEQLNIKVFEAYFGISGDFIRCASHNDWWLWATMPTASARAMSMSSMHVWRR